MGALREHLFGLHESVFHCQSSGQPCNTCKARLTGARIALESLPCRCSPEARAVNMERYACDRCQRLAELSEGR